MAGREKAACDCRGCSGHAEAECLAPGLEPEGEGPIRETSFRIDNMDCADCAEKLEQRLKKIRGVQSAEYSFGTGAVRIVHNGAASGLLDVIERSGFHVAADTFRVTKFDVEGLDCIDCARKFEKAIALMPGVIRASLDFATARLSVEHACPTGDIVRAAGDIGYRIRVAGTRKAGSFYSLHGPAIVTAASGGLAIAGFASGQVPGVSAYVPVIFYFLAIAVGGLHVARSAIYSLKTRTADMNLLMAIAIVGAMAIGRWEEGAAVVVLFALGNALQAYTLDRTRNSIRELMALSPREATVRRGGGEARVNTDLIGIGDVIVVRPGERIAMDGTVVGGASWVSQAPITGEAMPVEKAAGDDAYAGTINGNGALEIRVTRLAKDNTLSRIVEMVEEAQARRAPVQSFIDRFTMYYTPAVIALAAAVAVLPALLGQPFGPWLYRGLVLLVISCPCALVVSTPVAIVSAIGGASRNGVLVKGGIHLEALAGARAVAFDKTGTLTRGSPTVSSVIPLDALGEREILDIAASLESRSEHPIASAVVRASHGRAPFEVADFEAVTGKGVRGRINGVEYRIGSMRMFGDAGEAVSKAVEAALESGGTPLILGEDGRALAVLVVSDELRPGSREVVAGLHRMGIRKTVMLTGDNDSTAKAISEGIGLDGYYAGLLPEDKAAIVAGLRKGQGSVVMVGDGINDAPALAEATVGIAMGATGSDTALETADVALMADDLSKVGYAIRLGRRTLAIVKENVAFAVIIKAAFIGLAILGMADLWMAVFADVGASLIVILNGMRLVRAR